MFNGFSEDTVQFFLDLKFHNNTEYFHRNHDRYVETVQKPFYELITELSPSMTQIDPKMEIRPFKCLSRIHRDTRFTRDKSPYRDHLWLLFRREAEPRDKALFYYFEMGPGRLDWGMGFWGENREALDQFRKRIRANPEAVYSVIRKMEMEKNNLSLNGSIHKRMEIPSDVPEKLRRWYCIKEIYIGKNNPDYRDVFSRRIMEKVRDDFQTLAPLYQLFRGCSDETL